MEGIGGELKTNEQSQSIEACCDMCYQSGVDMPLNERLNIFKAPSVSRKRRRAIRVVEKDGLRAQLIVVRDTAYNQKPDLRMIGLKFFCADSVIDEVCAQAKFVNTSSDLIDNIWYSI